MKNLISILKKYTSGQLDQKEDKLFSQTLVRMKFDQSKKKEWEEKLRSEYGYNKETLDESENRSNKWIWFVALIFALIAALVIYNNVLNTKHDPASNYIAELNIPGDPEVTRKSLDGEDELREQAMLAYSKQNYREVIKAYDQLTTSDSIDDYDRFYLGIAHLKLGQTSEAAIYFRQAYKQVNLEEEIDWCLALALASQGEIEDAKVVLNKIIYNEQFKSIDAKQLLEGLESE